MPALRATSWWAPATVDLFGAPDDPVRLTAAVDLGCAATVSVTAGTEVQVAAAGNQQATGQVVQAVHALLAEFRAAGHRLPGLDVMVDADVPAGLNLTAAVRGAVAACVSDLLDEPDLTGSPPAVIDWATAGLELLVLAGLPGGPPPADPLADPLSEARLGRAALAMASQGRLVEIGPLLDEAHLLDSEPGELAVQVLLTFDAYGARRCPGGAVVGLLAPRQARAVRIGIDGTFGGRGYQQPIITIGTDPLPRPVD